jgi:flagellar hook-length control protein FliK
VPSVASEASTVRHAHLGQGPRSNFPSAESADQASPFASLVDTSLPPKSPPLASPPPPSQKPAERPQDGHVNPAPSAEAGTQKKPSDNPAAGNQAGGVSPSTGPKGTDIAGTALGTLAKKGEKDTKSTTGANGDPTITNGAADASAAINVLDAAAGNGTTTAVTDSHGDKTAKSDSSASDSSQAASPPANPSASQPIPAVPQPVAVAVSAPVIPAAPIRSGNNGADSGTGRDASQIAALGDAVKAGAPRGKADRAGVDAAKSGGATAGSQTSGASAGTQAGGASAGTQAGGASAGTLAGGATADGRTVGNTKPGTKSADTVAPTPAGTPQPTQKDQNSAAAPGQPNAADAAQSRGADAVPATEAATNRAPQLAASGHPADASAGPQANANGNPNGDSNGNSNVDPNRDQAGAQKLIEDITRQALDPTARRIEALAAETAGGGTSHPATDPAGSAQQTPDGSAGGLIAPASQNPATAPTGAATTAATPTAIPIAGLAVEIAAHAHAGKNRFEIRLDPPELGRIDVRLDVDHQGKVTSHVVVDRVETLDILRRDAPELERSLQQAGLKTADNGLQFSLRDHGGFGGQNPYPNNGSPAGATRAIIPDRELPPVDATTASYGGAIGASAGIDIRV